MRKLKSVLVGLCILTGMLLLGFALLPKPDIKQYVPYSSVYYDKAGRLLRVNLSDDERYRLYQPLASFAPNLVKATLLYEDQDFYQHWGVDLSALIRAGWDTYIKQSRRVGASTITMQVARLRWNIRSNNLTGKLQQIFRAVQLSRHYSKDQILELYLNLAPYGRNIEGVAAASLIYFNKKSSELNLLEALTLAVIPQNPNKRNPTLNNTDQLHQARLRLFERWVKETQEDEHYRQQIDLPLAVRSPEQLPFHSPHFINYLESQRSQWQHGETLTTLDLTKQRSIEQLISNYVKQKKSLDINNAAALLLNYKTMSVEAMVGSADFSNAQIQGQVNAATAKRSPGSTLKPFVYGLALDEGLIHPMSLLKDSPRRYGGFTPENYDKQFLGPISAKGALIESRNVPAVDLQAQLQQRSFYDFLKQAGVSKLKPASHYGLALALGGGETSMLELASLYAMLANLGEFKRIQTQAASVDEASRFLLSKEASYLVLDMLKDNPSPQASTHSWQSLVDKSELNTNHIAWKTGTSWSFRDAWSVGISGDYVLVVWVGHFNGESNPAFIGRTAAGPLLFSIFNTINASDGWQISDIVSPEYLNLKRVNVCAQTGDLYEKHCGASTQTWFIPGVSPIHASNIYRPIPIDIETGLRACYHRHGKTNVQVYEFWPSDFLAIFRQAGIALKTPPNFVSECDLNLASAAGKQPIMTSPQSTVQYSIQIENQRDRQIPLKAIIDPDVELLHWFVDRKYLGSVAQNETLLWDAQPGEFTIRAVDDSGRASSTRITVKQVQ